MADFASLEMERGTGEISPGSEGWLPGFTEGSPGSDMAQDLDSIHVANATCAAFHADVAAKHAASLAHWVQYLWQHVAMLQKKVIELEQWKKQVLDDTTRLRAEHKLLRQKLAENVQGDSGALPGKSSSMPLLLADKLDIEPEKNRPLQIGAATVPPPGLEPPAEGASGSPDRQVRFVGGDKTPPAKSISRSISEFSSFSDCSPTSLEGCLKLKVPDCPVRHSLEYYLKIGAVRRGPFKHNFSESTVSGYYDFGFDWLEQVDADQALTVTVEILKP